MVKHLPAMWEKAMAPHSSTLAWKIPRTEEPGRLQSMGLLRVGHDWVASLSLFTFMLEKEMATHSSVLAWRIPGTGEPGGLLSMGSHRVGHNWSDLAAAAACLEMHIVILYHQVYLKLKFLRTLLILTIYNALHYIICFSVFFNGIVIHQIKFMG